jgi:hypothetical protein
MNFGLVGTAASLELTWSISVTRGDERSISRPLPV